MTAAHTLCQLLSLGWDTPQLPIFSNCMAFLCLLIALVIKSTYAASRFCPSDLCKDSMMRLLCSCICFQETNAAPVAVTLVTYTRVDLHHLSVFCKLLFTSATTLAVIADVSALVP